MNPRHINHIPSDWRQAFHLTSMLKPEWNTCIPDALIYIPPDGSRHVINIPSHEHVATCTGHLRPSRIIKSLAPIRPPALIKNSKMATRGIRSSGAHHHSSFHLVQPVSAQCVSLSSIKMTSSQEYTTPISSTIKPDPTPLMMNLRTALNTSESTPPKYIRLADLREECGYLVSVLERVNTPQGGMLVATLEGQSGDDSFLRVYLPRRFNHTLSDQQIQIYNSGIGKRFRLVKRSSINLISVHLCLPRIKISSNNYIAASGSTK